MGGEESLSEEIKCIGQLQSLGRGRREECMGGEFEWGEKVYRRGTKKKKRFEERKRGSKEGEKS